MLSALSTASTITSGVALVAFVIAAALVAYTLKLKDKTKAIENTPADQRLDAIRELAQNFGIPLSGLSTDQQFAVVTRILESRRFYAIVGLAVAALITIVAIVAIIFQQQGQREHVGPLSLNSGETRSINVNLARTKPVNVTIDRIEADWSGQPTKRRRWLTEGKGLTPEIWFSVCSTQETEKCRGAGTQRGIHGSASRTLPAGSATVTFFNFRENPPISFEAVVDY